MPKMSNDIQFGRSASIRKNEKVVEFRFNTDKETAQSIHEFIDLCKDGRVLVSGIHAKSKQEFCDLAVQFFVSFLRGGWR